MKTQAIPLHPVERISVKEKERFHEEFLKPNKPVIFKDLSHDWPAYTKWTYDYFKQLAGHVMVDLYNNLPAAPDKSCMAPDARMTFGEYLDLIEREPTDLRIFLFNLMKYAPQLKEDYRVPDVTDGFLKELPFLFFGGTGSIVHMHYDIDMSHVFLTQFKGVKRVVLFAPEYTPFLYHLPFTVQSYVNVNEPDFERYPALRYVQGYECYLEYGDTLFIPAGYWHYIEYIEGGFGMSLRALNPSWMKRLEGAANLFVKMPLDNFLRKYFTQSWYKYKHRKAFERAEQAMKRHHAQAV
ncbi:cupin-like domain-containing protein [Thermonema rossianum]|uniref:cupin-like domain-containing protein n=1 Tax=Thermonema rossianum TaxID=55505 RepID=UPI00056FE9FE|nr:cupin-like domain-containing protein [Thermonema rossianum]